ncbi:DUF4129 domain-containing protein [Actinokineospora sp.]|uniref:DUF4129 domain-containing protein n=1 Tax=Actinokineospora sp. TaxID=1872133 RepID=UPI003D6BEE63
MPGRGDPSTRAFARLAALIAGVLATVAVLRVPRLEHLPGPTSQWASGDPAVVVLALLAGASLVLLVLARLRFPPVRSSRAPKPVGAPRRAWLLGLVLFVAVLGVAVAATWLPRPGGQEEPRDVGPPPAAPPGDVGPIGVTGSAGAWLMVVLLLVLAAMAGLAVRKPAAELDPGGGAAPGSVATPGHGDSLAAAAAAALSAVEGGTGTPREAVIGCYAAMEHALARSSQASPRAADTPSEVLGRAAGAGVLRAEHAWPLVRLFDEARFSGHPMTSTHQQAAVAALRTIITELRSGPW